MVKLSAGYLLHRFMRMKENKIQGYLVNLFVKKGDNGIMIKANTKFGLIMLFIGIVSGAAITWAIGPFGNAPGFMCRKAMRARTMMEPQLAFQKSRWRRGKGMASQAPGGESVAGPGTPRTISLLLVLSP